MPAAMNDMKICSNPDCEHNGEPQPVSNFSRCKSRKDGFHHTCKDCVKKHYQMNKKEILKQHKEYHEANKDEIHKHTKEYREKNKEKILKQKKEYRETHKEEVKQQLKNWKEKFAKYDTFYNQISKYEACRRDEKNPELIQVKCKYCGDFFNPTNQQIKSRLDAICGIGSTNGECNLYCSDACKKACPSYRQQLHFKNTKQATSREVQAELRQLVLERDNWTCQKC